METLVIVFHVLAAIAIIALILIQQGKGADMGASFGSGASQTLFGSRGTGNALTRSTAILATVFFVTSLALSILARHTAERAGTVNLPVAPATQTIPASTKAVDDIPSSDHNSAPAAGDIPAAPAEQKPAELPH
jgi:preprotein translocase subunit SecG